MNDCYFVYGHKKRAVGVKSHSYNSYNQASAGIEPAIEVLQTFALPLGYDAKVTPPGIEPGLPP